MKKITYIFITLIITTLFILTSCQTEPPQCNTCNNNKSISCEMCYGRGEAPCGHCSGTGKCEFCEAGYKYEWEDCGYCTNGVIVNPYTWATIDCPKCYSGYVEVKEECFVCDGKYKCYRCHGTGIANEDCGEFCVENCKEIAGQCEDCQGLGKIDCPDCE